MHTPISHIHAPPQVEVEKYRLRLERNALDEDTQDTEAIEMQVKAENHFPQVHALLAYSKLTLIALLMDLPVTFRGLAVDRVYPNVP